MIVNCRLGAATAPFTWRSPVRPRAAQAEFRHPRIQQHLGHGLGAGDQAGERSQVPQGAELCYRLRAQGFAIPQGLYLLGEVRDAILALAGRQSSLQGGGQPALDTACVSGALPTDAPATGDPAVMAEMALADEQTGANDGQPLTAMRAQALAQPTSDAPEGAAPPSGQAQDGSGAGTPAERGRA